MSVVDPSTVPVPSQGPVAPVSVASPASVVSPAASSPSSSFDLLGYLSSQGVDARQFSSPQVAMDSLLGFLREQNQRVASLEPLAQLGQEFSPHANDIRSLIESKVFEGAGQGGGGSAVPQRPDPRWEQTLEFVNGRYRAPQGMPELSRYAQMANDWLDHQRSFIGDLSADPFGTLRKSGLDDWWKEQQQEIRRMVASEYARIAQENEERQFYQQQQSEFCELGPDGRPLVDPITGNVRLSAKGQAYNRHLQDAASLGISKPELQRAYADKFIALEAGRDAQATPAANGNGAGRAMQRGPDGKFVSAAASADEGDKRAAFLDRVKDNAQSADAAAELASGTGNPNAEFANPDTLLNELADSELRARGLTPRRGD